MRRLSLTLFFSAIILGEVYADLPIDFFLQSEYKKDTIDYNETERTFYREKLSIFFSRESLFNVSYIYLQDIQTHKYTWNLILNDISPYLSLFIGNYFANFGTGLLIGRKRQYDPDIFSSRTIRDTNTFSPCKSGNPVFAFNGIAGIFFLQIKDIELSFNMFYSIKERFISQDSYDTGQVPSSIDSIDDNLSKDNTNNELIEIHTKGMMISAVFLEYFQVQTYMLMTDLRSFYKEEINWDYDETYNESRSISQLIGYGVMAKYKDSYLCFLLDYAATKKELLLNDGVKKNEYGYGFLYGLEFTHPFISLAVTGKNVESNFYSPYSSSVGDDYPESAWFIEAEIKPYSNLKFMPGISSQKRNRLSSGNDESPVINRENFSIIYSCGPLKKINLVFRRREKTDDENNEKIQVKSSINIAIIDSFIFKLSGLYQTDESNSYSNLFHSGFVLTLRKNIKLSAHYLKAKISEDNIIYSIISPIRNSSTQGFFIRQDSNIIIAKSDVKIGNIYLSCRYSHQFTGNKSISKRLEFYASGYF